jgi:hypothetical protein
VPRSASLRKSFRSREEDDPVAGDCPPTGPAADGDAGSPLIQVTLPVPTETIAARSMAYMVSAVMTCLAVCLGLARSGLYLLVPGRFNSAVLAAPGWSRGSDEPSGDARA